MSYLHKYMFRTTSGVVVTLVAGLVRVRVRCMLSLAEGSVTGEGVPGQREVQEPLAVLYVRALIECIAACLSHQQCV
jgi:hypothetical protein